MKRLVTGGDDPLLSHLVLELATASRADIVVSFILSSGLASIFEHLQDLLRRGGALRILTGDYLGITDPDALMRLMDLEGDVTRRVFETGSEAGTLVAPATRSFHPKAYIFRREDSGTAFVGSSNLSAAALTTAVEWNYRVLSSSEAAGFAETVSAFEKLFAHPSTRELTAPWIERYRARRPVRPPVIDADVAIDEPLPPVEPNAVQVLALAALEETQAKGNRAGLVVLATGLGKTWLAAFDSNRQEFRRVLFVAHREEILSQALATFSDDDRRPRSEQQRQG